MVVPSFLHCLLSPYSLTSWFPSTDLLSEAGPPSPCSRSGGSWRWGGSPAASNPLFRCSASSSRHSQLPSSLVPSQWRGEWWEGCWKNGRNSCTTSTAKLRPKQQNTRIWISIPYCWPLALVRNEDDTWYSIFPVENEELVYGAREEHIIWDPDTAGQHGRDTRAYRAHPRP